MDAPAQGCAHCSVLQAQVEQLQTLVRQLREQVRELQARVDQDSSNSHKPPSSDPPWTGKPVARKPTGRRPGGQAGHQGHHRGLLPPERVHEVVAHVPGTCRGCGSFLCQEAQADDPPPRRHQVAELPPLAVVITEHQGHARRCRRCGVVTRESIPPAALSHVTGLRLSALISYLSGRCHDGRRTVKEVLRDVFGLPLSLGTVVAREQEMGRALEATYRQARGRPSPKRLAGGWTRRDGNRRGRGAGCGPPRADKAACFLIDRRRNSRVLEELVGKLRGGGGIVTSDRHPTYNVLPKKRRQLCWSHLEREFVKWVEKGEQTRRLGSDGKAVCRAVFGLWRDFRQGRLSRRQLQRRVGPLRRGLEQILRWHLGCADKKAAEFCRRLGRLQSALWTFARHEHVEPTNNHAERMLRLAVLWRKNSFGCHSEAGCRFAERMLTAVQTLRLRGRSVMDFLFRTLQAHRQGLPCPPLD